MKKILTHILILVILVGFFTPLTTNAQSLTDCAPLPGWFDGEGCISAVILWVLFGLMALISLFLMLAGTLLDFIVNYTITEMSLRLTNLNGINIAWKILKDLMNIAFIFILLYESIKMIIGQGSKESIKRFILGVVLASILINFSLFFTKVLIDASNVITIGLYDAIIDNSTVGVPNPSGASILGLSTPIMRAVGLTSFFDAPTFENMSRNAGGVWNMVFIPILGIILFLVVTFVFLAISVMLLVRFLTLILLLVLSPVAYMGMALDFMKPYASQWWNAFNSQLIFPPVFMLMMLIALTLITSPGFVVTGSWGSITDFNNTNPQVSQGTIELLFKFASIIGLIIASLSVSSSISKKGSTHIGNATSRLSGYAGAAVMGGAGRVGRGTIGRWGANKANDEDLKDRATRGGVSGSIARMQLAAANRAATSSFDGRATDSFGALAKAGGMGSDFGKVDSKKTNFRAIMDAKAKEQEELVKRYEPSKLEVERVKTILDSDEFKAKEEEEKKKHLNSEEFKNSDIFKNSQKAEEENKKLEELTKNDLTNVARLKQLEESKVQLFGEDEIARKTEIENLKKQIEDDKKIASSLKETAGERAKYMDTRKEYEKLWMSDTQKDLISRKGGQEEKKKDGKVIQNAVEGIYQTRAKSVAERYENGGVISKYGAAITRVSAGVIGGGILGGLPGAIAGGAYAYGSSDTASSTKTSRNEIARRMRAVAKAKKSTKEQLEDILKESGEVKESEPKEEKKEEEEKPKTT